MFRVSVFIFLSIFLLSGCSQKYVIKMEEWIGIKKGKRYSKRNTAPNKKRIKYSYNKIFPPTKRRGISISSSDVVIYHSIPKHCKKDGWVTFYISQGIVYKSSFIKDIRDAKMEEIQLIKKEASRFGIKYVYDSILGTEPIREVQVYDPLFKRKMKVIYTPDKRVLIENNKIYKESVRILRCYQ